MSKKSRKRNKKILAAIGIGLGAAALASRNKRNASIQANEAKEAGSAETGKKFEDQSYSTGPKKDTAVKTKTTIQDNKSKDTGSKPIPGIKAKAKDGKVNYIKASKFDKTSANKEFKGPDAKYDYKNRNAEKNTAGIAKPKKYAISMANLLPKSGAANEFKASTQDYNRSSQAYKSGGRVKGCGKALRGFGKAMKGKR